MAATNESAPISRGNGDEGNDSTPTSKKEHVTMSISESTTTVQPPSDADTPGWACTHDEWTYEPAARSWYREVRSERAYGVDIVLVAQQRAELTSAPSQDFPQGTWRVTTEAASFDGELGRPFDDPGSALARLISWAAWLLADVNAPDIDEGED